MSSMESLNTQTTEQQEKLVLKKNAVSVVWTHFGFSKDDIEQNEVRCRHCRKTVSTPKERPLPLDGGQHEPNSSSPYKLEKQDDSMVQAFSTNTDSQV
ncbi:E3 SUMO-protein ligase ZBED1-like [Tachysurus ichikawai]